ncbi:MAG: hypothetical protein PHV82_14155, partial [Victivallaceae bacterium]|nr:hypothetical protein [Victivallaceae bacterium]
MKKIFAISSLIFSCALLSGQDLYKSIQENAADFWTLPPDKFKAAFGSPESYQWRTALKKNLIYKSDTGKTKLFFMGRAVIWGSFLFSSDKLQGMYLTLARTDAPLDQKAYLEQISSLETQINETNQFGKPKTVRHDSGNKHRCTYSWKSPEYYIALRYSYSQSPEKGFSPGKIVISVFHRFSFTSSKAPSGPLPEKSDVKTVPDTETETDTGGDRCLNVPMLKEKAPQDCVTACMRRLFAYYKTAPRDRNWKKISKNLELNEKSAKGLKNVFSAIAGECRCKVRKIAEIS